MATGQKSKTKQKGKLAKALSGAQAAQQQRDQAARTAQAEHDKQAAIAKKMRQGAGAAAAAKKRKLNSAAAVASASTAEESVKGKEKATEGDVEGQEGGEEVAEEEKKRGPQPFNVGERVLLVGEGNFSFAHSLLLPLSAASSSTPVAPLVTPSLLLCTAFDTLPIASEKYPDLDVHVSALRAAGATVLFGVDATKLEESKEVREFAGLGKIRNRPGKGKGKEMGGIQDGKGGFDKIVFNFPHVGQGITDQARNIRQNQSLLLDFYRSSSLLLRRGDPSAPGSIAGPKREERINPNMISISDSAREVSRSPSPTPPPSEDEEEPEVDASGAAIAPPAAALFPPPSTRGTILLTLRTTPPYSHWLPSQLATKGPLLAPSIFPPHETRARFVATNGAEQPSFKTVRSWGFEPGEWEGYEHRRTIGWDERKSSRANDDIRLTAQERSAKRYAGEGGASSSTVGAAKGDKGEKGSKEPPMRTWEFELFRWQDQPKRGGLAVGTGKNRPPGGKVPRESRKGAKKGLKRARRAGELSGESDVSD